MRIAIGCDHRGVNLKQSIIKQITAAGHSYKDFGCFTTDSIDYPDIAGKVAQAVADGKFQRGVLLCGTGIGMCITSNKIKGIRAALCHSVLSAQRARLHNDANILCLAADENQAHVPEIVSTFLTTEFEGGRHQRRVDKISALEG